LCLKSRQLQLEFITDAGFEECGKYNAGDGWKKYNN
jgi:hypothetical protein